MSLSEELNFAVPAPSPRGCSGSEMSNCVCNTPSGNWSRGDIGKGDLKLTLSIGSLTCKIIQELHLKR